MIDRRAFLNRLGFGTVAAAAAASGVLDIEKLLWTPGEKTIFIPPLIEPAPFTFAVGDIFTVGGRYAIDPFTMKPTSRLQEFIVTSVTDGEPTIGFRHADTPRLTARQRSRAFDGSHIKNYGFRKTSASL